MRNFFIVFILALFTIGGASAQITVSGILDSTVSLNAGAGDNPAFFYGIEEFANIRFQSRHRDGKGIVYGAVNLIAAAGDYAANMAMMGVSPIGQNFMAVIEIERLHFRLNGEHVDFDCGLMRLPFGYGQVWGPSDFLNPKNPLKPDARPRAILGAAFTWFPIDEVKLLGFFAAPRDVLAREGNGSLFGLSLDRHWNKISIQTFYSFETPKPDPEDTGFFVIPSSAWGIHRVGFSLKADIEIGFVIDALYTYNHEQKTGLDGLSFSIGVDYSVLDGNLIILAEYLFNGENSSTSIKYGGGFSNNHYLYAGLTYRFSDFTNMSFALISCLDDVSFTPLISVNHELFQGAALSFTAQIPLDRDLFTGDGNRGELGPRRSYFNCTARIRLRF
jgi:hypothetical protein